MAVIVSRSGWGAQPPVDDPVRIATPTPRLWVHHTGTEQHGGQGVRDIQRYHQTDKGWNDIAYSFLVDDDGTVFEGRGVGVAGAHTEGDNSRSHAICLMGNFDERAPTAAALESLVWLARHGRDAGWWTPTLGGHRDAPGAQTACPGRHLYAVLGEIRNAVATGGHIEEDDMPLTDADFARIRQEVITALADPTHQYLQDELSPLKKDLAALKTGQAALAEAVDRLQPGVAADLSVTGTLHLADPTG